jgi:hypothetical protein
MLGKAQRRLKLNPAGALARSEPDNVTVPWASFSVREELDLLSIYPSASRRAAEQESCSDLGWQMPACVRRDRPYWATY